MNADLTQVSSPSKSRMMCVTMSLPEAASVQLRMRQHMLKMHDSFHVVSFMLYNLSFICSILLIAAISCKILNP